MQLEGDRVSLFGCTYLSSRRNESGQALRLVLFRSDPSPPYIEISKMLYFPRKQKRSYDNYRFRLSQMILVSAAKVLSSSLCDQRLLTCIYPTTKLAKCQDTSDINVLYPAIPSTDSPAAFW